MMNAVFCNITENCLNSCALETADCLWLKPLRSPQSHAQRYKQMLTWIPEWNLGWEARGDEVWTVGLRICDSFKRRCTSFRLDFQLRRCRVAPAFKRRETGVLDKETRTEFSKFGYWMLPYSSKFLIIWSIANYPRSPAGPHHQYPPSIYYINIPSNALLILLIALWTYSVLTITCILTLEFIDSTKTLDSLRKKMWQRMQNNINSHFGLTGYWLNFWVMVSCSTAMLLFGYDQGVFGEYRFELAVRYRCQLY